MNGSKMTTQRKAILAAVKKTPPAGDYLWDGKDEGWRPRMDAALQLLGKKHPEWLKKLG